MKIKKIEVKNFKAVSEQIADFNGCSAIITAGNNKGKTSFLRGLIDRFKGEKPEIILKIGEDKGLSILELTDGSRIEWKFTEKTESFAYITKEGIKQTQGVLSTIGERYFGQKFNIDVFLNSPQKTKNKMLADLIGLDFENIDLRHKEAYDNRTEANRILNSLRSQNYEIPEKIEKPDIEMLEKTHIEIREKNIKLRKNWTNLNEIKFKEVEEFNNKQRIIKTEYDEILALKNGIESGLLNSIFRICFDFQKAKEIMSDIPVGENLKTFIPISEPSYISETEIILKIKEANEQLRKFDLYEVNLRNYNEWIKEGDIAKKQADDFDLKVKNIEKEKRQMIENAKIPKEFQFTEDGILYNNLPLSNNQISSSDKYIAALKLGAMALGKIRTLHFDASFLDKNSLSKIQDWALKNDLQLLIERPDFEAGEIKYEILNK